MKPRNAIFNFTISGLTAAQTNVGVSLTGPSGLEVTGSVPTDESGKAAFAVGAYKSSGARLKAFDLTVGGKSIPLMLSSDLEIQAGTIYNIARSPLSNAFVKGNETSFAFTSFMGGLTLAATYSGSSFGYVTKGGALADYVSTASMAKEGNNLVVSIAVTGLGSGSMTIDTASSTYKWSSGTAGNYITLNSITIGGQPIMPLPELQ